jgi:hypothetical protein
MTDERIDFSPLDPTVDDARFEAIVDTIGAAAESELARRRARASVVGQVGLWWKPLLAAAAITGIISVGALLRFQPDPSAELEDVGIAEAIGMPDPVAEWVRSDEVPTISELILAMEDES